LELALCIAEWFHPYRAAMIPLENFQIAFVVIGAVALLSLVDTLTLSGMRAMKCVRSQSDAEM
ncbi:hypothetical protein, partial [Yersinia alsatica]|uniref:hypothetical protein n=1 Tax=Yersinia alsatica TaxID=2890317 RepID=UPI001F3756C1